jgi:hypothetical protein
MTACWGDEPEWVRACGAAKRQELQKSKESRALQVLLKNPTKHHRKAWKKLKGVSVVGAHLEKN